MVKRLLETCQVRRILTNGREAIAATAVPIVQRLRLL